MQFRESTPLWNYQKVLVDLIIKVSQQLHNLSLKKLSFWSFFYLYALWIYFIIRLHILSLLFQLYFWAGHIVLCYRKTPQLTQKSRYWYYFAISNYTMIFSKNTIYIIKILKHEFVNKSAVPYYKFYAKSHVLINFWMQFFYNFLIFHRFNVRLLLWDFRLLMIIDLSYLTLQKISSTSKC